MDKNEYFEEIWDNETTEKSSDTDFWDIFIHCILVLLFISLIFGDNSGCSIRIESKDSKPPVEQKVEKND